MISASTQTSLKPDPKLSVQLLGEQSNDIDVALANMMGVAFAEEFVDMVSSKNLPVKTVATIARNPEQSKHLETARTTVLGIELDFVNEHINVTLT